MAKTAIGEYFYFYIFNLKRRLNSILCCSVWKLSYFVGIVAGARDVGGAVTTPMSQKDAGR